MGSSGSGKTRLASELAKRTGTPFFELDDIFWDNRADAYGIKAGEEQRQRNLLKIINQDSWIIEGVFYGWVGESFGKADQILVLDAPFSLLAYRMIRRYLKRKTGREKSKKKETLKSLTDLLRWTRRYQKFSLPEIMSVLAPHMAKVKVLRGKKESDNWMKEFTP